MRKRAEHYCEVLNRIMWKIPPMDYEKVAAEATELLHMHNNDRHISNTMWKIFYSIKDEKFLGTK